MASKSEVYMFIWTLDDIIGIILLVAGVGFAIYTFASAKSLEKWRNDSISAKKEPEPVKQTQPVKRKPVEKDTRPLEWYGWALIIMFIAAFIAALAFPFIK